MNLIKKQTAGIYTTFAAMVLGIVSFIVYVVSVSHVGYFQNSTVSNATMLTWLAIIALCLTIVFAQLELKGAAAKTVNLISDILRVIAPAFFMWSLMEILSKRIEGFAFIYFSNEEVLHEVQTAENMFSAHSVIANLVLLGVTAVVCMVAAFMNFKKEA